MQEKSFVSITKIITVQFLITMEQKDSIVHTNNTRGKAHKPLSKGIYPFKLTNESSDMINTPNTSTIIDHAIDIVGGGIVKRD